MTPDIFLLFKEVIEITQLYFVSTSTLFKDLNEKNPTRKKGIKHDFSLRKQTPNLNIGKTFLDRQKSHP